MSIENENDNLIKIIVIGPLGVGKTSFIEKWTKNEFNESYNPTIIPECRFKLYEKNNKKYKIQIWDLPGGKKNKNFIKFHAKNAHGCVVIFDSTRPKKTYDLSIKQKDIVDKLNKFIDGKGLPSILVESKCDYIKEVLNKINLCKLQKCIKNNGFINGFIASSKINADINESMEELLNEIILRMKIFNKNLSNSKNEESLKKEEIVEENENEESEDNEEENKDDILRFEPDINNEDAVGEPESNKGIEIKFEHHYSGELEDEILEISMEKFGYNKLHKYSCEMGFKELKKKYAFLSVQELDYGFIDNLEVLNNMNKVKVKLSLKNIMIRVGILICDLAGDEHEMIFDLYNEDIEKEELKDFLIKKLIKKRKKIKEGNRKNN